VQRDVLPFVSGSRRAGVLQGQLRHVRAGPRGAAQAAGARARVQRDASGAHSGEATKTGRGLPLCVSVSAVVVASTGVRALVVHCPASPSRRASSTASATTPSARRSSSHASRRWSAWRCGFLCAVVGSRYSDCWSALAAEIKTTLRRARFRIRPRGSAHPLFSVILLCSNAAHPFIYPPARRLQVLEEVADDPRWKFEFPDPGPLGLPVLQARRRSARRRARSTLYGVRHC
jgi:hypothetical protein